MAAVFDDLDGQELLEPEMVQFVLEAQALSPEPSAALLVEASISEVPQTWTQHQPEQKQSRPGKGQAKKAAARGPKRQLKLKSFDDLLVGGVRVVGKSGLIGDVALS
eukprot:SAG22_NODE_7908_length_698_cov_1.627713_1_plen_107_part_00